MERVTAATIIMFWTAVVLGWIINLIEVIRGIPYEAGVQTFEILQIVGIFLAPLGAIMGWIEVFR